MKPFLIFMLLLIIVAYFVPRYQPTKPTDNFEVRTWKGLGFHNVAQIFRNGKPCGCKHVLTTNDEIISISVKATGPNSAVVSYDNGKTSELVITGDTITVIDYDKFGKPDYTGEMNK